MQIFTRAMQWTSTAMLLALFVGLMAMTSIHAQAPAAPAGGFIVATGANTGTYSQFFREISQVCSQPPLQEKVSGGSIDNLNMLLNNQVNAAIVQSDVLFGRKLIENDPDVDNIRTLMPLYREEVHFIKRASNGNINKFSDLGNKKVGTFGGSGITARVLFGQTRVRPIELKVDYANYQAAMGALAKGEMDAIIAVGGQPVGWIAELGNTYALVPFDMAQQVANVYSVANLSYPRMSQTTIQSVAIEASLVTVNYKSKDKKLALSELKSCIKDQIDTLQETTGNHKKWREVKPDAVAKWPMYEVLQTAAPAQEAKPTKKGGKPVPKPKASES